MNIQILHITFEEIEAHDSSTVICGRDYLPSAYQSNDTPSTPRTGISSKDSSCLIPENISKLSSNPSSTIPNCLDNSWSSYVMIY